MKTLFFLLVSLGVFGLSAFGGSYRGTTGDMYRESYVAAMRRQGGVTAAEIRAEAYRNRYEVCNEHHNCVNVTANKEAQTAEEVVDESERTTPVKFLPVPVWY